MMAAGAAQPRDRPGVLDLDLVGREQHRAQLGAAAVVLHAVAEQPVAVLAPAGERPPAAHPVAPVHGHGRPGRTEDAADDDVGTPGVEGVERRPGKAAQIDPAARQVHRRPGHRRIRPAQLLDHAHRARQVEAAATVAAGHQHAEAAGRGQIPDEVERQPPRRLDLGGTGGDPRSQAADGIEYRRVSGQLRISGSGHGGSPFRFDLRRHHRQRSPEPASPVRAKFRRAEGVVRSYHAGVRPGRAGTRTRWRRRATTPRSC